MTPDVVVDVGNSRIKWGWQVADRRERRSLPPDEPDVWEVELARVRRDKGDQLRWVAAGSHPDRLARFVEWAQARGDVTVIRDYRQLPIAVDVDEPDRVGLDRLLNTVALAAGLPDADTPGVAIDVGTAVTVNLVKANRFLGGAILPGPRLMADALHRHTARLPLVDIPEVPAVDPPGRNTADAIRAGVMAAIMGAAEYLVRELCPDRAPQVVLTGGSLGALVDYHFGDEVLVTEDPHLTLEGIRLTARHLL